MLHLHFRNCTLPWLTTSSRPVTERGSGEEQGDRATGGLRVGAKPQGNSSAPDIANPLHHDPAHFEIVRCPALT